MLRKNEPHAQRRAARVQKKLLVAVGAARVLCCVPRVQSRNYFFAPAGRRPSNPALNRPLRGEIPVDD